MNRRGFFSRLALVATAASVSPHIFIPKFDPVRWKVARAAPEIVFNPADYAGKWVFESDSALEFRSELNWFYTHIYGSKSFPKNAGSVFTSGGAFLKPDPPPLG